MQTAETILSILSKQSKENENFVFKRLYRNLFNPDFYVKAYQKMYAKEGNMTAGTDGKTIDGFNFKIIDNIIEMLRNEHYYPKPVKRTYIPKKNGKMRPLGIPSFKDKLVQEVLRQILEAIYEPIFSNNSHGFRPNKSCQTALYQVKTKCKGTNWVVEGDIQGCFDNIDHDILLKILQKKIDDGRFIELIRRFLKSGYMEWEQVYNSLSGTPQGQIASPILANIYLSELDEYVEKLILEGTKGKRKKPNPDYTRLNECRCRANKKGDFEKAAECLRKMRQTPTQLHDDAQYIRINYVRYADDWLVCVNGSKTTALKLKDKIRVFLKSELNLELSEEKTLITNLSDRNVKFLGYEISKSHCNTRITKNSLGIKRRSANETIQLLVPADVITKKLQPFTKNRKSIHHSARVNLPILDIISEYNSEIRGLYNYYSLATDVSAKIGKFKFYHYFSLAKTIALKEKTSVKKIIDKYGVDVPLKQGTGTRKIIGTQYRTKDGEKTLTYFNDSLKKMNKPRLDMDDVLKVTMRKGSQLIQRINACQCELCGKISDNPRDFEVHHIRKLKDIKKRYAKRGNRVPNWLLTMCAMNRKTLIVCKQCHDNIHYGKNTKQIKNA